MLRDRAKEVAAGPPAQVRGITLRLGRRAAWDAAIVIPAKDEEDRLPACLDAAGAAIRATGEMTVGIVLVVNNSTDATAQRASDWAAAHRSIPFTLIDCDFPTSRAGVGAARRLGLDTACSRLTPNGALLTTDADTLVREDWVIRNLAELQGADLICGTVLGQPDEARALPAEIAAHGSAEWDYLTASISLVARLDPQPHDPTPAHHNPAGASLAVSRAVYEAVGGLPTQPTGEDRAFADLVDANDFRIRFSAAAVVETSCRMIGRTEGGMAGALRSRAFETDPFADEWIEAADTLALRHGLRGHLRAVWPDVHALHRALSGGLGQLQADRIMASPTGPYFGAFVAAVEQSSPQLARHRLRLSDCRRELPRLLELLATVEPAPAPDPVRLGPARQTHAEV